jgi:hypothetical protein
MNNDIISKLQNNFYPEDWGIGFEYDTKLSSISILNYLMSKITEEDIYNAMNNTDIPIPQFILNYDDGWKLLLEIYHNDTDQSDFETSLTLDQVNELLTALKMNYIRIYDVYYETVI